MAWYRTGTVTVTTGSATVVGAGTDFVSNVVMGDGFRGPDGRTSEIARVVSATELTLAEGYAGPSAGGQPFAIQPTQSYLRDLAQSAATLLATFGAVRDGIGQGLIGDGSLAAPGIRFAADQDTGLRRYGENGVSMVTGGVDRMYATPAGIGVPGHVDVGAGRYVASNINDAFSTGGQQAAHYGLTMKAAIFGANPGTILSGYGGIALATAGVEAMRFDFAANMLVGAATSQNYGSAHRISRNVAQGGVILSIDGAKSAYSAGFFSVGEAAYSEAQAAILVGRSGNTGRSINAGGTINASGADYAEYMTKAAGCGTIAAGDVCGVDIDGRLTRTWADARSFVVKSTDPAYVGGDTWAASIAPRPEAPGAKPIEPAVLPARPEDDAELEAWRALADAYPAALAAWNTDHSAWQAASAAYDRDLPAWEAALEAERVKVDRIAFCGQVPVNVTGDFAVGDYLIAAAAGAGIKAVAIPEGDITFDQYRRRLGKVWAVRDGRAWVDVQHG